MCAQLDAMVSSQTIYNRLATFSQQLQHCGVDAFPMKTSPFTQQHVTKLSPKFIAKHSAAIQGGYATDLLPNTLNVTVPREWEVGQCLPIDQRSQPPVNDTL